MVIDIEGERAGTPGQRAARCSFCSKERGEVLAMFAGPVGIYICNECIGLFAEEVAKRQEGE